MNTISPFLTGLNAVLLATIVLGMLYKTVLFLKTEKQWHPVKFLYYSKASISVEAAETVKESRKQQNSLSKTMLIVGVLLLVLSVCNCLLK